MGKRLTDPDRHARLDAQAANVQAALEAGQQRLALMQAQWRKLAWQQRHDRRRRWGALLDELGLLALDEAVRREVVSVAYTMVQRHGGRMPRTTDPEWAEWTAAESLCIPAEDGGTGMQQEPVTKEGTP